MQVVFDFLGNTLILLGVIFMGLGTLGTFRFQDFFRRILVTSKIDTVGFITICFGMILRLGFSFFSLKILVIVFFFLATNPTASHLILRSADFRGYKIKKEDEQ